MLLERFASVQRSVTRPSMPGARGFPHLDEQFAAEITISIPYGHSHGNLYFNAFN